MATRADVRRRILRSLERSLAIVGAGALVYHSLYGLRVIALDFWPRLTVYYRGLTTAVIVSTVVSMIPLALLMITPYAPWGPA